MLMWYVIQVIKGREEAMVERIERVLPADVADEVFYPQYTTQIKVRGVWSNVDKPLFPGYLMCITDQPRLVEQHLLRMDDFARVLRQGDEFVPLAKEETVVLEQFTHRGERIVPMSQAIKEGDNVVVTAGPLLGHEAMISCINRHKSIATLEFDLCGRHVTARLGLAVLSKEQWAMQNLKRAIA